MASWDASGRQVEHDARGCRSGPGGSMRLVIHGDAREVLRGMVPAGAVVVTDPPWPEQSRGLYDGAEWTPGLLRDVLDACAPARRVVILASSLTDPRWLGEVDQVRWPFVTTFWMRYAVPSYRGTRLLSANVAHVFGDHRPTRGRRVFPQEMTAPTTKSRPATSHPTPMKQEHAAWCVGMVTNEGDTVVDPFTGSGIILRAAVEAGCHALGAEIGGGYAEEAQSRLDAPFLLESLAPAMSRQSGLF